MALSDLTKLFAIVAAVLIGAFFIPPGLRVSNEWLAPLLLNSRIERLGEKDLPKVLIQGSTVYCRMKADDFRFSLPPASRAANAVVSGIFDSADGSIEAHFDGPNRVTASEYEASLAGKVQIGGYVTAHPIPKGLLIKFSYFGDR